MSLLRSPSILGSGMCKAVIAGFKRCALCSLLFLAGSDALHHGGYEPEGPFSRSSSIPAVAWTRLVSAGMELKGRYAACLRPRSSSFSAAACVWLVLWVTKFHAVFPSVVGMLKMHLGWYGPEMACPWLVCWSRCNSRCVPFVGLSSSTTVAGTRLVLPVTVHITSACWLGAVAQHPVFSWTRMLTCPLLFGNRVRYAQCNCAVCSWQGWCLLVS